MFADCGLGKTLIFLEYVRHLDRILPPGRAILYICPLMVVQQTAEECERFYGDRLKLKILAASEVGGWLADPGEDRIGITNYESLNNPLDPARLSALVVDESSMLKSHYGKWGTEILRLGRGIEWKLAGTGTPAPNDRIEYANHAVLMGACPNVNAFLARFFVNKGQTQERWILKPHAIGPFYRALSHWSMFLTTPATYGWSDNASSIPPIRVHIHRVPLTKPQRDIMHVATGSLFANPKGIASRSILGQLAKGRYRGDKVDTLKPAYIRNLVDSFGDESTIIWCLYNAEQDIMAKVFPDAANLAGATPHAERQKLIAEFKSGKRKVIISKPKVLGFGLNLQVATRQVVSGLQDSYEQYYQAVKRSNRVGSTKPLDVHIPVTELEEPMVQNVLNKADRVHRDTLEQERIFHEQWASQRISST